MLRRISVDKKGFTLLELMISLVVMMTAFMGILPFFFYAQKSIKESLLTQYAVNFVEQKMERIKDLDYDLIDYQDFADQAADGLAYIYILPEVNGGTCMNPQFMGGCGFNVDGSNMLKDIVNETGSGYYFTRHIDIDDSEESDSWEPGEGPGNLNLPDNSKRITIRVSWTIPGGKQRFVTATTERAAYQLN